MDIKDLFGMADKHKDVISNPKKVLGSMPPKTAKPKDKFKKKFGAKKFTGKAPAAPKAPVTPNPMDNEY